MEPPRDVPIRPASTVLLIRDADPTGVEVFALRRATSMAFAGGMTAFPGGAVDPSDDLADTRWRGPDIGWFAERLGVPAGRARALVVAAIRELFEETGVQLVHPGPVLSEADRVDVLARRRTLDDVLAAATGLADTALLRPWANWITPPGRTRRYDTFFFIAALPAGQRAEMLTTEADLGTWARPGALLDDLAAGRATMLPPTVAMLTDLAAAPSVPALLAEDRHLTPVHHVDPRRVG